MFQTLIDIHHQELATVLLNYHISHFVLGSLCVGDLMRLKPATWTLLNPAAPNLQHTMNREQNDRCGNSTAQSQAPDDGYILMSETC